MSEELVLEIGRHAAAEEFVSRTIHDAFDAPDYVGTADGRISELVGRLAEKKSIRDYEGEVFVGSMPMHERAIEVKFTDDDQSDIIDTWSNMQVRDRLGLMGAGVLGGLIVLIGSSVLVGGVSRAVERRDRAKAQS